MLKLSDFDYDLPQELIAQFPSEKRSGSRLLVLDRRTGKIEHRGFEEITQYLGPEDLLVLNDTKVIPARIFGTKYGGGGVPSGSKAKIEVLLDRRIDDRTWEALARPAKRLAIGGVIEFARGFYAEVREKLPDGKIVLHFASVDGFEEALGKYGRIPLPPYIMEQHRTDRYQTVYAKAPGATAAPTAGLHFTEELLGRISAKKAYITLHTGYGTFAPVRAMNIEDHKMHSEVYDMPEKAHEMVKMTRSNGGRIVAVGTTSARLLESARGPGRGGTSLFIYPGYKFKLVDALITNFHLPRSTLIMLVSAFAGLPLIKRAYKEAIDRRYRFFSFGDAMLIL